jgi:hypothetical protein
MQSAKRSFILSAHKFHSPCFARWYRRWYVIRAMEVVCEPSKFGEVKVTVGFDNSDPNETREADNDISWRTHPDFQLRDTYEQLQAIEEL